MKFPEIDGQHYFVDPPDAEPPRSPFDNDPHLRRSGGGGSNHDQTPLQHYRLDPERPFLKKERAHTTILFGGLTWKHERLLQAVMQGLGYQCAFLPTPDISALRTGREYCNNGQCNPTYFTVGNLLRYLQSLESQGISRQEILDSHVFFTAGACGPCRFGMYESEFRLALKNAGYAGFRILILQQLDGLDQAQDDAGLEMNLPFTLGILYTFILADQILDLGYQFRPYEIRRGATDTAIAESIEILSDAMLRMMLRTQEMTDRLAAVPSRWRKLNLYRTFLMAPELRDALKLCRSRFEKVELDRSRVRPIVKITGEFWAQTTEGDGNFRMFSFLEEEGAQVLTEPISTWILYMLHQSKQALDDRRGLGTRGIGSRPLGIVSRLRGTGTWAFRRFRLTLAEHLFTFTYNRFRSIFGNIPEQLPNQVLLRRLAQSYYHPGIEGGEGHLEVAKSIYYSQKGLCHMVLSLKPFGCMPSTQSDGVHSAVTSHYPDLLFLPIETSGEGVINAYSRVQMALSEARLKAHEECDRLHRSITERQQSDLHASMPENAPFLALPATRLAVSVAARVLLRRRATEGRQR